MILDLLIHPNETSLLLPVGPSGNPRKIKQNFQTKHQNTCKYRTLFVLCIGNVTHLKIG